MSNAKSETIALPLSSRRSFLGLAGVGALGLMTEGCCHGTSSAVAEPEAILDTLGRWVQDADASQTHFPLFEAAQNWITSQLPGDADEGEAELLLGDLYLHALRTVRERGVTVATSEVGALNDTANRVVTPSTLLRGLGQSSLPSNSFSENFLVDRLQSIRESVVDNPTLVAELKRAGAKPPKKGGESCKKWWCWVLLVVVIIVIIIVV